MNELNQNTPLWQRKVLEPPHKRMRRIALWLLAIALLVAAGGAFTGCSYPPCYGAGEWDAVEQRCVPLDYAIEINEAP